jgi:hypothetical protein
LISIEKEIKLFNLKKIAEKWGSNVFKNIEIKLKLDFCKLQISWGLSAATASGQSAGPGISARLILIEIK